MCANSSAVKAEAAVLHADTILINARVHTQNNTSSQANSVAIAGSRITFVGSDDSEGWSKHAGPSTRVVDLGGSCIIPGIIDSHTHPGMVASTAWRLILPWSHDVDTILRFIRDYAEKHPASEVPLIYGEYYPADLDWGASGPTAAIIDNFVSDRPVLLEDILGHASVANSKALELMGVDAKTPLQIDPHDPAPSFVRAADGVTPTGWVLEGAHHYYLDNLYKSLGWFPPEEVTAQRLSVFTRFLTSRGVTALFDAWTSEECLAAASALDSANELNLHYSAAVKFASLEELPDAISEVRRLQAKYGSNHLAVNAVKLFLDGTNEVSTGAVIDPYASSGGALRMSEDDMVACMSRLNDEGIDLHVHICGDLGFRAAMNAVARARTAAGAGWKLQVTTAHNELIDPADAPRPAELGVILNVTPHWVGGEMGTGAAETLGWERFNRVYDYAAVIEAGTLLTFSSDVISAYEMDRADPFLGMQIGHTRSDERYPMPPGLGTVPGTTVRQPESARIPLEVLLDGYTRHGARQLRLASRMGSVEVGKDANLVVLSADPSEIPSNEIAEIETTAVIFEGRVVFGHLPGEDADTTLL